MKEPGTDLFEAQYSPIKKKTLKVTSSDPDKSDKSILPPNGLLRID